MGKKFGEEVILAFQSSFELTGYITTTSTTKRTPKEKFQSSFELTGYITDSSFFFFFSIKVSKLFRAYGLYNNSPVIFIRGDGEFQSSFELTGYITKNTNWRYNTR